MPPAAGTVVAAVDSLSDSPMGTTDREHPAGNHVILDHGNGEYSLLAHLQRKSLRVRPGEHVAAGQLLGLAGNSGNTSEISEAATYEALARCPAAGRIAVVSFNDDAATGATWTGMCTVVRAYGSSTR